jgi:hypothetical protein
MTKKYCCPIESTCLTFARILQRKIRILQIFCTSILFCTSAKHGLYQRQNRDLRCLSTVLQKRYGSQIRLLIESWFAFSAVLKDTMIASITLKVA